MKFKTFFFSFLLDTALFITERRKKDILKKKTKQFETSLGEGRSRCSLVNVAEGLTGGKEADGSAKEYILCTFYNETEEVLQKIFSSDTRQNKIVEVEHGIFTFSMS